MVDGVGVMGTSCWCRNDVRFGSVPLLLWGVWGNCKVGAPHLITKGSSCGLDLLFTARSEVNERVAPAPVYKSNCKGGKACLWYIVGHDPIISHAPIKAPLNAPKYDFKQV